MNNVISLKFGHLFIARYFSLIFLYVVWATSPHMASNLNRVTCMISNVISNMMLLTIRRLGSNLSLLSETKKDQRKGKQTVPQSTVTSSSCSNISCKVEVSGNGYLYMWVLTSILRMFIKGTCYGKNDHIGYKSRNLCCVCSHSSDSANLIQTRQQNMGKISFLYEIVYSIWSTGENSTKPEWHMHNTDALLLEWCAQWNLLSLGHSVEDLYSMYITSFVC